jgi:hypothetical protein
VANLNLQPSISDLRSSAHLGLINRLGALDLTPILVYRIPQLVDSAVLAMAWQWDVLNPLLLPYQLQLVTLSYPSWDAAADIDTLINVDLLQYAAGTEESLSLSVVNAQYRALILLSTSLHSILGTPQALLNALVNLGYPDAKIQEGQNSWGGTQYPSNEGWAVFRVLINLATVPSGTDITSLNQRLTAIANYWKPARCWLDSVQFTLALTDTPIPPVSDFIENIFLQRDFMPTPSDFIAAPAWPMSDMKTIAPFYNDRYYFGSNLTYGRTQPAVGDGPLVVNGAAVTH